MDRRHFLIGAGTATAAVAGGTVLGRFLGPGEGPSHLAAATPAAGPLVVVSLYGGNDGVNTLIPYTDSAYHAARPTLGYQPEQVLDLADGMGLNPKLKGFQSLWKSKQLAVVRGVGYPNPNLSHFASMDIWQTANPTGGSGPGWLGRWLDTEVDDPLRALSIGATLPPMLRGEKQAATALTSAQINLPGDAAFQAAYSSMQAAGPDRAGLAGAVAFSGEDLLGAKSRLAALGRSSPGVVSTTPAHPAPAAGKQAGKPSAKAAGKSDLSGQLQIVASLINAGAPTRVYQVSLASFDTHSDEKANHERLLGELDAAVTGFLSAVQNSPAGRQTVLMTFSEFGRRPAENASGGTDHGTASALFVAGHGVKGGQFYGDEPSLTSLDANGNLRYTVDFRSVYATVLERVVGTDPERVLGGRFPTIPFV